MIHRFLAVYGYINVSGGYLLTDVENIVRVGPTMGIVTSLDECNQARYGSADWQNHIADGEKVFLLENSWYDPIAYLYAGGGISAYSTIDTPAYDDSVLAYWTKYPDKAPDVIAVKVWGGGEDIPCDSWFEQYLHTHYELSGEGMLWHFYRPR